MIRDADEAMRRVPVPEMPEGILERVFERRAADIRTLLPTSGPVAKRRRFIPVGLIAAVATIGLATIGVVAFSGEAAAGASELELGEPSTSVTTVPVRYRPGSALAGASTVVVRARVWSSPGDTPVIRTVGTLARDGKDLVGDARLPAGADFALIALEDQSGNRLDLNGGSFWEYSAGGAASPTPAARAARLDALQTLSEEGLVAPADVRAAAVSAALAAPEDIDAWDRRATQERRVVTDARWREELLPMHLERLRHFERTARSPDELALLVTYADRLDDHEAAQRALRRLEAVAPHHQRVAQERVYGLVGRLIDDPPALFAALEDEWYRGEAPQDVASIAYSTAFSWDITEEIRRWAPRYLETDPRSRDGLVDDLAGRPGLERLTIDLARARLAALDAVSDDARPLHESRDEFRVARTRQRARLLAALGAALLASDSIDAGRARLAESLDLEWSPRAARALVSSPGGAQGPVLGDVDPHGLEVLLAADPVPEGPLPAGVEPTPDELDWAHGWLIDRLERDAPTGEIRDVSFRSRVGGRVPIDDGGTRVIALWKAVPRAEHPDISVLADLTPRLVASGIEVLLATPEAQLDDAIELAADIGARPVVDELGTATESFGGWYAYAYVVVHDGWYSVHNDFTEAVRLALLRSLR